MSAGTRSNRSVTPIGREQSGSSLNLGHSQSLPAGVAERVLGKPIATRVPLIGSLEASGVGYASLAELLNECIRR